jgi:radical SAM protein with 4Fe4S-binding SPASM domain
MDNIAVNKLPSCLQTRSGWAEFFESKRTAEPHIHQIEPTNHCSYTCIMCPRSKYMTRPKGYMKLALYQKIIDEIATYSAAISKKDIELFHFGESLLHPKIVSMVEYAANKQLKIVLSVNPLELTPKLAEKILQSKPHKIIISLDGYDDQSYKAIRGAHANFTAAVKNIEALLQLKKNELQTQIIIRMILVHMNEKHAAHFKLFWENKGAIVEIRSFFPWNKAELAKLGTFEKYPPHMPCPFSWQYIVVQWNGDVVPCCRDYNAVNVLGNVTTQSLKAIWNGATAVAFRKQMAIGEYAQDLCKECMELYYTASN